MNRRMNGLFGAAVLVVALAGCGGDPGPAPAASPVSPTPSSSPTLAAPADGGRYATPEAVVAAMETAGISCAGYEPIANPIDAVARGSCYIGANEITVGIYATTADAKAHPRDKATILAGVADIHVVVGANWTCGCDEPADCQAIAVKLGGEMVSIPK